MRVESRRDVRSSHALGFGTKICNVVKPCIAPFQSKDRQLGLQRRSAQWPLLTCSWTVGKRRGLTSTPHRARFGTQREVVDDVRDCRGLMLSKAHAVKGSCCRRLVQVSISESSRGFPKDAQTAAARDLCEVDRRGVSMSRSWYLARGRLSDASRDDGGKRWGEDPRPPPMALARNRDSLCVSVRALVTSSLAYSCSPATGHEGATSDARVLDGRRRRGAYEAMVARPPIQARNPERTAVQRQWSNGVSEILW